MAGTRYEYRLWRKPRKTGFLARFAEHRQVTSTNTDWFDLSDKDGTVEQMARLIARYGDEQAGIEEYWLEILDPATHSRVTIVEPSGHDLASSVNGNGSPGKVPQATRGLAEYSDEALMTEVFRRLQERLRSR